MKKLFFAIVASLMLSNTYAMHRHTHKHRSYRHGQTPPALPPQKIDLAIVLPSLSQRLNKLEKHNENFSNELQNRIALCRKSYFELTLHKSEGIKTIDRQTYLNIDAALIDIEEQVFPSHTRLHLAQRHIPQPSDQTTAQLDKAITGPTQQLAFTKIAQYAGLGSLMILILYQAYHYYYAHEDQQVMEKMTAHETDEKVNKRAGAYI